MVKWLIVWAGMLSSSVQERMASGEWRIAREGNYSLLAIRYSPHRHLTRASRPGKQGRAPARHPIGREPDPFAHRRVGAAQAARERIERQNQVHRAARAPVDRVRLDRKAGTAKNTDR